MDELTFAEFGAHCDGFEAFHAAPKEDAAITLRAPTAEQFKAALGLSVH